MASFPRFWLAVCAGALSLTAATASLPASAAAAGSARACGSPGLPVLSVRAAGSPTVTGSMLVAGAGRRITVPASPGGRASVSRTTASWLEFCLRPAAVSKTVTLLRIAPAGVTVGFTRTGRLTLSSGPQSTSALTALARPEFVEIVLDRRQGRVSVFVNGGHAATLPAAIPAGVNVYLGSSAPSAPAGTADTPAVSTAGATPTAFAV